MRVPTVLGKRSDDGPGLERGSRQRESSATTLRFYLCLAYVRQQRGQGQSQGGGTLAGVSTEEFEKQTQNPIASLISVPSENNTAQDRPLWSD
jgi:hypothetical protein